MPYFAQALTALAQDDLLRSLTLPAGVDFTSNDYLGMAAHPALRHCAIEALEGGIDIGAAGSRLLRGHTQAHEALERFSAEHFQAGGALYFSSGFQANFALLTTLPQRNDVVLFDALAHASMRDGLIAGRYKSAKFTHNDMDSLEQQLKRHALEAERIWIVLESLYSMDGDIAPLDAIYDLAERYDAMLIIDEAHATGVYGEGGRGLCWEIIQKHGYERLVTLHTCGKAIGVAGGLVCGSKDIIDYLINAARPFIYSTAPMPLQALLVQKSLKILASGEGDQKREKLQRNCKIAEGLFGGYGTQIVPFIIGENAEALAAAKAAQDAGLDVRAVRPPTVAQGTARLRISLSSEHSEDVLHDLYNALKPWVKEGS